MFVRKLFYLINMFANRNVFSCLNHIAFKLILINQRGLNFPQKNSQSKSVKIKTMKENVMIFIVT